MSQILVIGSEGGLGKEVVSLWKTKNFQVSGVDLLSSPQSECDSYLCFDLLNDSPQKLNEHFASSKWDQVIFCAATGFYGDFLQQKNMEQVIDVNFTCQVLLLKELEKKLKPKAQIIFVGSVASHMPTPQYELYSASKLAIESFVRSWRWEVRGKYDVKIFLPAAMKTAFHKSVGFEPSKKMKAKFAEPKDVAWQVWKASQRKKWRSGVFAASIMLAVDHFLSHPVDKGMWLKKRLL